MSSLDVTLKEARWLGYRPVTSLEEIEQGRIYVYQPPADRPVEPVYQRCLAKRPEGHGSSFIFRDARGATLHTNELEVAKWLNWGLAEGYEPELVLLEQARPRRRPSVLAERSA